MDTQERNTAAAKAPQGIRQWWMNLGSARRDRYGLWLSFAVVVGLIFLSPTIWLPKHKPEPPQVVGEFRTRNYTINDHEHVVVFDAPNRDFPTRCYVYVNERISASNMKCDLDDNSPNLPDQGAALER